jgi:hypothetical protein
MAVKDTIIFHSKALQNLPKLGFWVRKYAICQPRPFGPWMGMHKICNFCQILACAKGPLGLKTRIDVTVLQGKEKTSSYNLSLLMTVAFLRLVNWSFKVLKKRKQKMILESVFYSEQSFSFLS